MSSMEFLVLGMVFGSVLLTVLGVSYATAGRGDVKKRLRGDARTVERARTAAAAAGNESATLSMRDSAMGVGRLLGPVTKYVVPEDLTSVTKLRRRLVQAGYLNPSAIGMYYVWRVLLAIGLPIVFLIFSPAILPKADIKLVALGTVAMVMLGLIIPTFYIDKRTKSLQIQYRESFPDALDLMVVCVEAGLGLDAAIERVRQELGRAHRALGENFTLLSLELRAGRTRGDALRNLADRLGIDEARSFVTLILQSEELGTSIADALRVYAEEIRVKRMVTAERKAHQLPVKLTIPLGLFVFPVILIVIMLPIVIRVRNSGMMDVQ